jgi:probable HAF family extracellular repeat protein
MRRVWARAAAVVLVVEAMAAPGMTGPAPASAQTAGPRPVRVTVVELRDSDGRPLDRATEVNNRGEVIARTQPDGDGEWTAVVWSRGRAVHLAPDGVEALAHDISDGGLVVGEWLTPTVRSQAGAFSWFRGRWSALTADHERGAGERVNERGQVLGTRSSPGSAEPDHAVVWDRDGSVTVVPADLHPTGGFNDRGQATVLLDRSDGRPDGAAVWQVGGGVTRLGSLGGDPTSTFADDINRAGHVAGLAQTADGEMHGFLWRDGEMIHLVPPAGHVGVHSTGLNGRDEVIGMGSTADGRLRGWLWQRGEMTELPTLGGPYLVPYAINARGDVVGESQMASGAVHAFLWRDGEMIDLGAAGGASSGAVDINDRGQILGEARDGDGQARPVLWTVR